MSIFTFGNVLTHRLSLSQKVLAIAGLFSVPIVVMLSSINSKYNETIHFTEQEILGVQITKPLNQILLLSGQHLGLSQSVLISEVGSKELLTKNEVLLKTYWDSFKQIAKMEHGENNKTLTNSIIKVEQQWNKIVSEGQSKSKNDNLNSHYDMLEALANLNTAYADNSQLTLDPDLDSYYVMDSVLLRMPQISESLSRLSGLGVAILSSKTIGEDDRVQVVLYKNLLKRDMTILFSNMEKATSKNPQLKQRLKKTLEGLKKELEAINGFIEVELIELNNDTIAAMGISPQVFHQKFNVLQHLNLQFSQQGFTELEQLLRTRRDIHENEKHKALGMTAAILIFALYLFLAIRRALSHDVAKLRDAANALAQGVLDHSIQTLGKDELWEISRSMDAVREAIKNVVSDVDRLSLAGQSGSLQVRADASVHRGGYQSLVNGLNGTLDAVVKPLTVAAQHVAQLAEGNVPPTITESFQGDFQVLRDNLNKATTSVNALVRDANKLVEQAVAGNLSYRAEVQSHQGDYRKIIEGVNATLDAVIEPFTLAIDYVDHLAKGALLPRITKTYNGDFSRLTSSLNTAIESISRVVNDINTLVTALRSGNLSIQANVTLHHGEFATIITGVNQALNTVAEPIQQVGSVFEKLAVGDLRFTVQD